MFFNLIRHAYYSKEDYESAIEAFENGLKIDPTNANLKTNLEQAKARIPTISSSSPVASPSSPFPAGGAGGMPDLSALAGMFGGGGGGGGAGGGMPDLSSLMQNPQIMQMAQSMMANGGMERLMQNPAMRNMVRCGCDRRPGGLTDLFIDIFFDFARRLKACRVGAGCRIWRIS